MHLHGCSSWKIGWLDFVAKSLISKTIVGCTSNYNTFKYTHIYLHVFLSHMYIQFCFMCSPFLTSDLDTICPNWGQRGANGRTNGSRSLQRLWWRPRGDPATATTTARGAGTWTHGEKWVGQGCWLGSTYVVINWCHCCCCCCCCCWWWWWWWL